MKKIISVVMLLLTFFSNFFYFTFASQTWEFSPESEYEKLQQSDFDKDPELDTSSNESVLDSGFFLWDENCDFSWIITDNNLFSQNLEIWNILDNKSVITESWHSWQTFENTSIELDSLWQKLTSFDQNLEWDDIEYLPNLFISEVFFWGTNERIEIYNEWDDFSGQITILWASASPKNFNISIWQWKVWIIKDSWVWNIVDETMVKNSNAWFSMTDSKWINIELMYSWSIVDYFIVDESIVKNTNSKVSLHRFLDSKNIVQTKTEFVRNCFDWYFANPWFIFNESDIIDSWDSTWDVIINTPNLKITEIYFDWDDNRFEISNIWDEDFVWEIVLSWNFSSQISTEIKKWVSKVFANSLSMFQTWKYVELIDNEILFENGEINLDLIWSGIVLDNFFVHESWIDYLQDMESSVEKIWKNDNWLTTYVWLNRDRIYNTNRWISANPTKYFTEIESFMKNVAVSRNGTEIYTWSDYDLPINCDDFWEDTTANISEIYFGTWIYPSYIELKIKDDITDYYDNIILSWSLLKNSLTFRTKQMKNNTFVLISSDSSRYDEWRESKYNQNFWLNDTWFLILYWDDGYWENTILDVVFVSKSKIWESVYMWSENMECAWVFDYIDKFSPWLNIWQSQFIQITPDPIIKYIPINNWWNCSSFEKQTFNTESIWSNEIQISAIKYYWNYQILKLKNKTNSDVNLRDYSIQTLDWNIQKVQWNTLFSKSTISFLWNYNLPVNSDFCINLLKWDTLVDRYCRNSLTKATAQDEENIKNQLTFREDLQQDEEWEEEEEINGNTWVVNNTIPIKIINIDYDPAWADWENESITLRLLTWWQVDLSKYTIQYIKDWKTTQTKKIQWILSYWNSQVFKWAFSFPNSTTDKKQVLVELLDSEKNIVDTYIYNPNKITEIPNWEYEVISIIDWDTIKIKYLDQEFSIRFAWIDAPESSTLRCGKIECFGPESKQYLTNLLQWKTIYFEPEKMDNYDRFVWYVFLEWENINEKIIKNWYAWEYSYKNQTYKYQSQFKSAQDYARNHSLWLRWNQCKWERICPIDETKIKDNFIFNIENVIYDPEWDDTNKEEIWISMIEWFQIEFWTDFYLLVNDTKKSLKKYWSIGPWETKKLVWTFWFPNTKMTTISFVYDWEILDTYTYDPQLDKEEQTLTWDDIDFWIIEIKSILPDPVWADWENEEISIFYSWNINPLNLSWFYLQIWTTKKKLSWELIVNQEKIFKWKFWFPNKWSCVEIWYWKKIFDKFCYTQPTQWQKFYKSNWILESISTQDLSILKKSKLQNIWNKVCLTYENQKFYCKNMPYSKLSTKKINQNKMYKEFFDSFEDYMKENWKIMYYDSEIKQYFSLLDDIEDVISSGWTMFEIDWINYQTSEFKNIYSAKYKKTPQNFISTKLNELLPNGIVNKYNELKLDYENFLLKKGYPEINSE